MNRKELLRKLKTLRFCVLWPGDWDDVGYTERPIWVNSQGYGYYSCDEPCGFVIIDGISDSDIRDLKQRINDGTISVDEIKQSPFAAVNIYDDDELWDGIMEDLLSLPDHVDNSVFCGQDFDGWHFYSSEEKLIEAFDKEDDFWGGDAWEDMSDEQLSTWYERLFSGLKLDYELPMTLGITKEPTI